MRHQIGFIALSLLAAAVAGCSSSDTSSTASANGREPLTGELAKYNGEIVPLSGTSGCAFATKVNGTDLTGTATITLHGEIGVVSLRPVDSALLINGVACTNGTTSGSPLVNKVITGAMTSSIVVTGDASKDDTIIFDFHSGLIAAAAAGPVGGIAVDLGGDANDQVAFLMPTKADAVVCKTAVAGDTLDLNGDTLVDVTAKAFTTAKGRFTLDLNDGDDTFDQADCLTPMSVYGGAGKDTITVGSAVTIGDFFGGGTDTGTGTVTQKIDTITFANRKSGGVTVTLNGLSDDGDTASLLAADATSENDSILDDFEVVTGTGHDDIIRTGNTQLTYTVNGGLGDDILSGMEDHGVTFNGGGGTDTVDYSYGTRTKGISVTIDGTQNDGYVSDSKKYKLDNVGKDISNIIGTDFADYIVGSAGANVIRPGGGNDIVYGGDGNDTMVGGMADGHADTADGDDIFVGGKDTDTVDYSLRIGATQKGVKVGLSCTFTGSGLTTAAVAGVTAAGVVIPVCPDSGTGTEKDKIGADVENIIGTIGDDHLYGNSGINVIWGLGGNDVIVGGAGIDQLDGNAYLSLATGKNVACNPLTLTCLDLTLTGTACDCAAGLEPVLTACTSFISCGDGTATDVGDSLDIASCSAGVAGTNYNITNADTSKDTCWTVQK